tara:strand:- start:286 stop:2151 length:1866 start_codon:yes stop_codon:yes gene_type:complete
MSSIVERLTEGMVNRDMRAEGHALLTKWEKTGLLEGIDNDRHRQSMARLLENQAKELLRESTSMSAGSVDGFAAVAFPIVRRVFAGLIANDLVSVQPMSLPSGLIFFLDFTFSDDLGSGATTGKLGNLANKSIYGTDRVGAEITGGVDLVSANKGDLSGPRMSARGYSYASPSGSDTSVLGIILTGAAISTGMTNTDRKWIEYDPDLLSLDPGDGTATHAYAILAISASALDQLDVQNLSAITCSSAETMGLLAVSGKKRAVTKGAQLVRRLSRVMSEQEAESSTTSGITAAAAKDQVLFTWIGKTGSVDEVRTMTAQLGGVGASRAVSASSIAFTFPQTDDFQAGAGLGSIRGTVAWGLEGQADIPEIDIKVDSIAVTAQTKKLKAKWTPELGQDLNAYHNLDAEVELTSILSEQIALEIDREIVADLVNGATAATYYWSRSPGLFVSKTTGAEIGASSAAPDFTGTVSEWYETLVETINDVSAQIHRKTLRGGANFVVVGPEVANILEFTSGFRASVTHDDEKGSIGAVKAGSLSKKFDVIVDPYFLRNVVLVGRRGSSFLESGYVYAPYVPLQTTPTIFGPEDFVPRKGVMTRYAKKMVRPDMYGLVIVRGLLGESGG